MENTTDNQATTTPTVSNSIPTIRRNSLIHGDCVEVMKHIPSRSINFILSDPPYLINYKGRDGRKVPNDNNDKWLKPAFKELYRILKNDSYAVIFYGYKHAHKFINAYYNAGFKIGGHFVFPKRYVSSTYHTRAQHEVAHLLIKGNPPKPENTIGDVIEFIYSGNKLHPTQKPVTALLPLIESFCKPHGIVLDPFAGSGSTLLACKMVERHYLGIELDANYHAIAQERLQAVS